MRYYNNFSNLQIWRDLDQDGYSDVQHNVIILLLPKTLASARSLVFEEGEEL